MKLAVDAMSGDLGSAIVVEACHQFAKNHPEVELYVTGKQEELESLISYINEKDYFIERLVNNAG
ncbi:MAG: hypothetical protein ACSW8B_05215, partial [bacterium]